MQGTMEGHLDTYKAPILHYTHYECKLLSVVNMYKIH